MTEYVAGFMFNIVVGPNHVDKVALIRKQRPAWQKDSLNGVGGHVEQYESSREAMIREFREETGYETNGEVWHRFCVLTGPDYKVSFFYAFGDLGKLETKTDEEIVIIPEKELYKHNVINNLHWLIPMARESRLGDKCYSVEDF